MLLDAEKGFSSINFFEHFWFTLGFGFLRYEHHILMRVCIGNKLYRFAFVAKVFENKHAKTIGDHLRLTFQVDSMASNEINRSRRGV